MKKRNLINITSTSIISFLIFCCGVIFYARRIEPSWIDVAHVRVVLPRLAKAFHGYRIVQISDIHADETWMNSSRLERVVRLINKQQPDVVVITGDFVTRRHGHKAKETLDVLRFLKAPDGVFSVLGNHDHWGDTDLLRTILKNNGLQELKNTVYTFYRDEAMLHLAGLDDLLSSSTRALPVWVHEEKLKQLVHVIPPTGAAILLVHEPDFADVAASSGRFDLQLSGHSHGGQIRIPFRGALVVPYLAHKYPNGLYHTNAMLHYTNRGVGMSTPHVRLNCRPEITVFTLLAN